MSLGACATCSTPFKHGQPVMQSGNGPVDLRISWCWACYDARRDQ